MAESMQGLHRTCRCAEVTKEMIGKEVVLMGWVQKARDKGGIIFRRFKRPFRYHAADFLKMAALMKKVLQKQVS